MSLKKPSPLLQKIITLLIYFLGIAFVIASVACVILWPEMVVHQLKQLSRLLGNGFLLK